MCDEGILELIVCGFRLSLQSFDIYQPLEGGKTLLKVKTDNNAKTYH